MNRLILMNVGIFLLTAHSAFAGGYILGGAEVTPKDPVSHSTVGVFTPNGDGTGSLCTGTLVKDDIALTAAHCITPGKAPEVIFQRDLHAPGAVHREGEAVAVNPKWKTHAGRGMDQGDIALVKFGGGAPAGYTAVPTLASDSALRKGQRVTLAGYGISNARTRAGAGRLRRTSVNILDNRPGKTEMILDQTHGRGACHGDSGGPAYVRSGGRISLAGLTNRSYPTTAPDDCAHGSVYTKVPAYRSWIRKNEKKLEAPRHTMRSRVHLGGRRAKRRVVARLPRVRRMHG